MNASDESFEWVSVSEASRRLGISPSEVRRRIRVGQLVGERQPRAPHDSRDRFVVQLPVIDMLSEHAQANAQPRADLELIREVIQPYVTINDRLSELYAGAVAELREMSEGRGRLQAERDNALARAKELEDRIDETGAHANELSLRLARAEQRANDAERRASDAEAELSAARAVPWWRRWWK